MTREKDRIIGSEAQALLNNEMFKGAFQAVGEYIEAKAMSCDPDNKEMAQRVILSKQILAGIKREIERQVETGMIAEVQINELEKKQFRFFRR